MLFRVSEKILSLSDNFTITDGQGTPKYIVIGQTFSLADKLSFQNPQGEELAFIQQKFLSLKSKYQIFVKGELFAEVVEALSWFKGNYRLDVPGPNDYEIAGSFWGHEYIFTRSGRHVASVQKKLWAWRDSYGVEIADGEDEVAILCTCIAIDQIHKFAQQIQ